MQNTRRMTIAVVLAFVCTVGQAGKLEKGLEALRLKDYYKAYKLFEKAMYREPAGGAFGKSLVFAEPRNPYFHLDSAMVYLQYADSAYMVLSEKSKARLSSIHIDRKRFSSHRQYIADVAYDELHGVYTIERLNAYMKKYPFATRHREVMVMRDSMAYKVTREDDTYRAYRQFIIDYPASAQRAEADSLYALRFYKEQTAGGNVDKLKNFVREFSNNPHTEEARALIYANVKSSHSVDTLYDHIRSFPDSPYIMDAWQSINDLYMLEFNEKRLKALLWDFPENPLKEQASEELSLIYAPIFTIKKDGRKGVIDRTGRLLSEELFDEIGEFEENLAVVTRSGKSGYIDKTGAIVVPIIYDDALPFSGGLGVVEKGGRYGAVNRRGEVAIDFKHIELGQVQDKRVPAGNGQGFIFLDVHGGVAIPELYEEASDFNNGYAAVKIDGQYGLIDVDGEFAIPALYDWVEAFEEGFARVKKDGVFGLYSYRSGVMIEPQYDHLSKAIDGRRLCSKDGFFGYTDLSGEVVIGLDYDLSPATLRESMFSMEHALVQVEGHYGIIDRNGEVVVPFEYEQLGPIKGRIVRYAKKGRYGVLDFSGTINPAVYEYAAPFDQGAIAVKKNGAMGLVDANGRFIVEAIYDTLYTVPDTEYCVFEKGDLSGVLHRERGEVIIGQYDKVDVLRLRYARLERRGEVFYYDLDDALDIWSATSQR